MRAGAGKETIIFPEDFFPTEGFCRCLDALHARVLVMEDGARHALAVLELTSIPPEEIEAMRGILKRETGADFCHVLATHTFSAPHFLPDQALTDSAQRRRKQQLQGAVYRALETAARQAVSRLCRAEARVGTADCAVATARDVWTPDGWWVGNRGEGPVDPRMTVLQLSDEDGAGIAAAVHYSVQSSVLDGAVFSGGGKPVSGDLAGRMAAELEKSWGCPVLFLIGAAGDQAPREKAKREWFAEGLRTETDLGEAILPALEAQAQEMAAAAKQALETSWRMTTDGLRFRRCTVMLAGKQMERNLRQLRPTVIPPYQQEGENEQPIELLQIGDLKLLGVRPELNCVTAREIMADDPMVRVVTLWSGGAKYLADRESCGRITYEAQNSPFYPGGAEVLAQAARALLKD